MIYSSFPATTVTPEMDFILSEIAMVWPWAIEQLSPSANDDIPKVGSLGDSSTHGCLSCRAVEWEFLYVILGTGSPGPTPLALIMLLPTAHLGAESEGSSPLLIQGARSTLEDLHSGTSSTYTQMS